MPLLLRRHGGGRDDAVMKPARDVSVTQAPRREAHPSPCPANDPADADVTDDRARTAADPGDRRTPLRLRDVSAGPCPTMQAAP